MSNKVINAVIALIEDRPSAAREMLRSPELKVSINEVQNRLFDAVRRREARAKVEALKDVLRTSLRLDPSNRGFQSDAEREAFILGISAVETIVENAIDSVGPEAQILSRFNSPVSLPGESET